MIKNLEQESIDALAAGEDAAGKAYEAYRHFKEAESAWVSASAAATAAAKTFERTYAALAKAKAKESGNDQR